MHMDTPLFRPEAIVHRRQRLWGELLLAQPIATRLLTILLVIVVVVVAAYLAWGQYARKQRVQGYLVPEGGWLKIYPPRPGVLVSLQIEEGQTVARGAPLATVSSGLHLTQDEEVADRLLEVLQQDVRDIEAQQRRSRSLEALAQRKLDSRIRGTLAEMSSLDAQLTLQRDRLRIVERRLESVRRLEAAGQVASARYDDARAEYLSELQRLRALERDSSVSESLLQQLRAERERLPLDFSDRRAALRSRLSEAARAKVEIRGRSRYTITAPAGGVVTGLQASVGTEVSPDRPMLTLLAKDASLEAVLFVPSRAVGFVRPGQEVRLRFDAFPHERFGDQHGVVVEIDRSIFAPSELPDPVIAREPVYRVRARPEHDYVEAYGDRFPLRPGMALEADIVIERRSLLLWLLDPLLGFKGRLG